VIETGAGGALLTVTEIAAIAWFPTVSKANVDRLCFPFTTDCEFQLIATGYPLDSAHHNM
jgi:hypothetical protein